MPDDAGDRDSVDGEPMFETAELNRKVSKKDYDEQVPALRTELLRVQNELLERGDFSVVVVMPEAIHRAVLRVVYRFRTPPLRTLTAPELARATELVRSELRRMGPPVTPVIDAFLEQVVQ